MKKLSYKATLYSCYLGYVTQAIVCNLTPILFVLFEDNYGITNTQIGTIVLLMFFVQLIIDFAAARFVDRIGFRASALIGHIMAATGLILLSILPKIMSNGYAGILISVIIASIGSGFIELLVSPIVDLLPSETKASSMSLLHAFYCWGVVVVVSVSTLFLWFIGNERWFILPVFWSIVPIITAVMFSVVPLPLPVSQTEQGKVGTKGIFKSSVYLLAAYVMFAGAVAELSMAQWTSYFAERGLGVNKVLGDLLGPCLFALAMAVGRTLYGTKGKNLDIGKALSLGGIICGSGYLICTLCPVPVISLLGCAVVGFGVSLMWPGTLSLTSSLLPQGGTVLFAMLALFGDIGCSFGPWYTGLISDKVSSTSFIASLSASTGIGIDQLALRFALLTLAIVPFSVTPVVEILRRKKSNNKFAS